MQRGLTAAIRHLLCAGIGRALLQLGPGLLLRGIHLEGQKPTELPGGATDLATEAGLTEQSADHAAERLSDLAKQIAEETLRCELLTCLTLLTLLPLPLVHLLQLLKLLHLLLELLHLLRELRIGLTDRILLEGQKTAELAGDTAYLPAESGLTEQPADGAAGRLSVLTDQVAHPSLRRELLHRRWHLSLR